jgi:DNA-binding MarR family transcriptional regulator
MEPVTEHVSLGAAPVTGTAPEEAGETLGRAFRGAVAAVRRLRGRDTQRPGEIAHAQYALLFELAQRGELPAGELAAAADLTPATVSGMLDHLTEAGLVARARSERDRRVVVCRLTPAGVERVAARHARLAPLWNAALAEFDAEELGVATAVLERVREFFETLGAGCAAAGPSAPAPGPDRRAVESGDRRR